MLKHWQGSSSASLQLPQSAAQHKTFGVLECGSACRSARTPLLVAGASGHLMIPAEAGHRCVPIMNACVCRLAPTVWIRTHRQVHEAEVGVQPLALRPLAAARPTQDEDQLPVVCGVPA